MKHRYSCDEYSSKTVRQTSFSIDGDTMFQDFPDWPCSSDDGERNRWTRCWISSKWNRSEQLSWKWEWINGLLRNVDLRSILRNREDEDAEMNLLYAWASSSDSFPTAQRKCCCSSFALDCSTSHRARRILLAVVPNPQYLPTTTKTQKSRFPNTSLNGMLPLIERKVDVRAILDRSPPRIAETLLPISPRRPDRWWGVWIHSSACVCSRLERCTREDDSCRRTSYRSGYGRCFCITELEIRESFYKYTRRRDYD
jgi:hypothetical protein